MTMRIVIEIQERDGEIYHTMQSNEILSEDNDDDIIIKTATNKEHYLVNTIQDAVDGYLSISCRDGDHLTDKTMIIADK